MRRYKCLILGENFLVTDSETGQMEELGFYTTRWIWAKNEEQAELKVLRKMRADEALRMATQSGVSKIYFEEIVKINPWKSRNFLKFGGGATWFPMEEKET